jgi:hypothetical protein
MVSDFLTAEWGPLRDEHRCVKHSLIYHTQLTFFNSEARILFKAGKQRDGWFNADHLLSQVSHAIDIFERKTNGRAQGLFLFDNAPSHQKRALDALSAQHMVKGVYPSMSSRAWLIFLFKHLKKAGPMSQMGHECALA